VAVAEVTWRPPSWRRCAYAAGAVLAVLIAAVTIDSSFVSGAGPGLVVVAGVLAVLAGLDVWHGVPLTAGADGIGLSTGLRRIEQVPWAEIERIEATSTIRGGLRLASLEIDLGERLVLLSRHRLGSDPVDVAVELRKLAYSSGWSPGGRARGEPG
jgi:hypothetical protein